MIAHHLAVSRGWSADAPDACGLSWSTQLSTEMLIMARPYTVYRELGAAENVHGEGVVRGAVRLSIAFGTAVSMLADGRLSLPLFVDGALAWTIVPALQGIIALAILAIMRERRAPSRWVITLFLAGNGPWMAWLLFLAAVPIVMRSPTFVLFPATPSVLLPTTFCIALGWASVVRHAFFRCAVGMTRGRAAIATLAYSIALWGIVVTFFAFADVLHR